MADNSDLPECYSRVVANPAPSSAMGGPFVPPEVRRCRICRCTETSACEVRVAGRVVRHCGWAGPDLCDHPHCLWLAEGMPSRELGEVLALNTGDPKFDPAAPVTINGFRFIPERLGR